MRAHLGVVLHVNQSNGNLFNWVSGDHNVSCHLEVYKNGSAEQYLDTEMSSWCQMDGNPTYLSVETEGFDTEPLTGPQMLTVAKFYAAVHREHGIPLELAERPGEFGFGWHGMGGEAWGGHTGCPGTLRRHQRARILQLAARMLNPNTPSTSSPAPADGYRFALYTERGGDGPVFASAPGRWRRVDEHTAAALIRHGEAAPKIHAVHKVTLRHLRSAAIGHNA